MSDRTCPKCKHIFKYPSMLIKHMKNSFHCLSNEEEIESFININQQDNINKLECILCKSSFTRNADLTRHNLKSKCGKMQEAKKIEQDKGITKLSVEHIKLLYPNQVNQVNSLLVDISNTNLPNTQNINNPNNNIQIQNIINNNNTNNDNRVINNITINNNITIPEIIYPFGYEDISFLNDTEMLEILKSPNGAIIAMEKVYSKMENRNFYKQNIGKDNITYIDKNFDKQIYKQKDFQNKLLYQSVEFMYRICFKCRDRISLEDQIVIMKNINIIEKTLEMKDDVASVVSAMLEREFMNTSRRDFIQKFNKKLEIDKTFKDDKLKFLKEIRKELNRYYINKTHFRITDNLLKDEAWTKSEEHEDSIDRTEICNNLNMYFINDTPRYKFFKEMKEEELNYLKDHGFTIADIRELIKIHSQRNKEEIAYIEETYTKERSDNIKDTLTKIEDDEFIDGLGNICISNHAIDY